MRGEFFIEKQRVHAAMEKFFVKGERILDVGCGDSPPYHQVLPKGITCLDITLSASTDVLGDSQALPFKDDSFDGIVCVNSFYYYSHPQRAVAELARITREGGKLLMVLPFIYPIHDAPHDLYRFTRHGIEILLQENYKEICIKESGGIFSLPAVILHSLIKGLPLVVAGRLRLIGKLLSLLLLPLYWSSQIVSLLDALDRSGRWPVRYVVTARKK